MLSVHRHYRSWNDKTNEWRGRAMSARPTGFGPTNLKAPSFCAAGRKAQVQWLWECMRCQFLAQLRVLNWQVTQEFQETFYITKTQTSDSTSHCIMDTITTVVTVITGHMNTIMTVGIQIEKRKKEKHLLSLMQLLCNFIPELFLGWSESTWLRRNGCCVVVQSGQLFLNETSLNGSGFFLYNGDFSSVVQSTFLYVLINPSKPVSTM